MASSSDQFEERPIKIRVQSGLVEDRHPLEITTQANLYVKDRAVANQRYASLHIQQSNLDYSEPVVFDYDGTDTPLVRLISRNGVLNPAGEAYAHANACLEHYREHHGEWLIRYSILVIFVDDTQEKPSISIQPNPTALRIVAGKGSNRLRAPSSPTQVYSALAMLVSSLKGAPPDSDAAAIESAFCDIFAIYHYDSINRRQDDPLKWTIGERYYRGGAAVRYVNLPHLDGAANTVSDLRPEMKAVKRGGIVRRLAFVLHDSLRGAGVNEREALNAVYTLFWTANKQSWNTSMSFNQFARDLVRLYVSLYQGKYPLGAISEALRQVGLPSTVAYTLHARAGFVSRLRVRYTSNSGAETFIESNQLTLGFSTTVFVPIENALTVQITAQAAKGGWKDIQTYDITDYRDASVTIWGPIGNEQAALNSTI